MKLLWNVDFFQHSAFDIIKNQDEATDELVVEQNNTSLTCFKKSLLSNN